MGAGGCAASVAAAHQQQEQLTSPAVPASSVLSPFYVFVLIYIELLTIYHMLLCVRRWNYTTKKTMVNMESQVLVFSYQNI